MLLEIARATSADGVTPLDRILSARTVAAVLHDRRDRDGGRRAMADARDMIASTSQLAPYLRAQILFEHEGVWAQDELVFGPCDQVPGHRAAADQSLRGLPPASQGQARAQLEPVRRAFATCR